MFWLIWLIWGIAIALYASNKYIQRQEKGYKYDHINTKWDNIFADLIYVIPFTGIPVGIFTHVITDNPLSMLFATISFLFPLLLIFITGKS